jgi:high-affinity iron transporter
MTKNLFSVPIFFIVFRETLEAAIIVSVLLGLAEQIVHDDSSPVVTQNLGDESNAESTGKEGSESSPTQQPELTNDRSLKARLARKLRIQVSYFLSQNFLMIDYLLDLSRGGIGVPPSPRRRRGVSLIFKNIPLKLIENVASFLAVWFTKATNLWGKAEELWEGMQQSLVQTCFHSLSISQR